MDMYSEKSLEGVKKIVSGETSSGGFFGEYDKFYPYTNECISGYLRFVDFIKKNSALSVLSSGDHVFSLISHGINNVDTFDINRLTEYYALG